MQSGESIIVGTDGSERAERAVDRAGAIARALGATVHVVGVYGEQQHIDRAQERLAKQGVESEGHLPALQEAGRTLVAFADEQHAQMIVVGNRGMTGAKRALGSVPNYVSHHAHCDVLIVHTT